MATLIFEKQKRKERHGQREPHSRLKPIRGQHQKSSTLISQDFNKPIVWTKKALKVRSDICNLIGDMCSQVHHILQNTVFVCAKYNDCVHEGSYHLDSPFS